MHYPQSGNMAVDVIHIRRPEALPRAGLEGAIAPVAGMTASDTAGRLDSRTMWNAWAQILSGPD
jgi:hypothetical protein